MTKRPPAVAIADLSSVPHQKRKASRDIIDSLRHSIASGELAKGQRLPTESDLAAHFGVSQPTVREGLRVLEEMGLITVRHGSGAYVTGEPHQFIAASLQTLLQVDRVGILDVVEIRTALASYSAARVVKFATPQDLDVIDEHNRLLEEAAQLSDFRQIADAAVAFQVRVSAATHNPLLFALESVLADVLVRLQVNAFSKRGASFWRKWSFQFASDRRELVAAFRARDEAAAVAAMSQYVGRQRSRFSAEPTLAKARLSDPELMRIIRQDLSD